MGKALFILFCFLAVIAVIYAAFAFGQPVTVDVPAIHVNVPPAVQNAWSFLVTPQ